MDKFWKWMKNNDYGKQQNNTVILFEHTKLYKKITYPTKLMLIGYMEKFIIEVKNTFLDSEGDIFFRLANGESFENIRYEQLKEYIEKYIEG